MARNDDKTGADNSSMDDDQKMLKKLFREELDIQKTGGQEQAPPEAEEEATLEMEIRFPKTRPVARAENEPVKKFGADTELELQEIIEESPIWRFKDDAVEEVGPYEKPGKRSHRIRPALLALLLVALGVFSVNYFGIVDLSKLMPFSDWAPTPVNQPRLAKKPPLQGDKKAKPLADKSGKEVTMPPPPQKTSQEMALTTKKPPNPPISKESPPILKERPIPEVSTEEPVAAKDTPEPIPSAAEPVTAKTAPETASVGGPAGDSQPPRWVEGAYPYSVYFGSYRTPEKLQKAVTTYGSMGLSPYWVQVDLGKKGMWFRVFAGFFSTRGEADAFIKENHVPGAASKNTKYAVLIGTYKSEKELNTKRLELRAMAFSSYKIKGTNGAFRLFTGAFYQLARAQKHKAYLASKGIQGEVVER
jgi:hypothetical protein